MSIKRYIGLVWVVAGLAACSETEVPDGPAPDDTPWAAGDTTGMLVTVWDTVTGYYSGPGTGIRFDVDGDNVEDLEVYSFHNQGPGAGFYYYSRLECLHPGMELGMWRVPDTTFHHVTVTWQYDGNRYDKLLEYLESCQRTDGTDSIGEVGEKLSVAPLLLGQGLADVDEFVSGTFNLRGHDSRMPYSPYQEVGDTLFWRRMLRFSDCEPFPQGLWRYVAFRHTDGSGQVRLGWFLMQLNGVKITISEMAVRHP